MLDHRYDKMTDGKPTLKEVRFDQAGTFVRSPSTKRSAKDRARSKAQRAARKKSRGK